MATVNFSVPDDVKQAFNHTFQHQNKSAVITELMVQAVERAIAAQQSHNTIQRILARHRQAPVISQEEISAILAEGRP